VRFVVLHEEGLAVARTIDPSSLTTSLDRHFEAVTARRARRGLPAPQALVRAPGFEYTSGDRALPFHAASVGKLATAILVMQEVESGRMRLTSPVESLLPAAEVRGLFAAPGATLEHLLAHTSGVADCGGIVTTLDDLARFTRALTDGTLVRQDTWASMTEPRNRFRPGIRYGLGAMQLRFAGFMPLLRGLPRPVGHLGVLGVHAFANPARDTTVILNFHGTREMVTSFQTHIRIQQGLARVA